MANLSFLVSDKLSMETYLTDALARRKQLCPFPLTLDDMIDVQHSPHVAREIRRLREGSPKAIHWGATALLMVPDPDHPENALKVSLRTFNPLPLACSHTGPAELYTGERAEIVRCWEHGPQTALLREWAWKALQIELENRWALGILKKVVAKATTHQQVHRYVPETYNLLADQEVSTRANRWGSTRFRELLEELKEVGSSRAQKIILEGVSVKDRSNLKSLIVHTLLLPVHNGLEKGVEFDQTWVDP